MAAIFGVMLGSLDGLLGFNCQFVETECRRVAPDTTTWNSRCTSPKLYVRANGEVQPEVGKPRWLVRFSWSVQSSLVTNETAAPTSVALAVFLLFKLGVDDLFVRRTG